MPHDLGVKDANRDSFTKEAKFIALSEGLCMTIPKMNLIEELKEETLECQAAKPRSSAEFLRKILC